MDQEDGAHGAEPLVGGAGRDLVPLAQVPADWTKRGSEWIACFSTALAAESGLRVTGHKYDLTTQPYVRISTSLSDDPSQVFNVLIAPLTNSTFLILAESAATGGIPLWVIDAWLTSVSAATLAIDQEGPRHEWSAIIGPPSARLSEARVGVDCEGLVKPGSFGPFTFASSGQLLAEFAPSPEHPSLAGGHMSASVPILVRGSHSGHSWDYAASAAAIDLHRACGLLSVAWGFCVTVRESPAPLDWGVRHVPARVPWLDERFLPTSEGEPVVDREIPSWANDAWRVMSRNRRVADAVAAFHEGMRAEYTHPSLAHVSFVASIEAISQMLFREERCSECKAHRHVAATFRETLGIVLDENEVEELAAAYSPRSYTVHRGRLYGYESAVGSFRHGIWPVDEKDVFRWNTVYRIRNASRALLTKALNQALPPKRRFGEGLSSR
jgi:hypothetical protein